LFARTVSRLIARIGPCTSCIYRRHVANDHVANRRRPSAPVKGKQNYYSRYGLAA
jgi:hypothetical protein